MSIFNVWVNTHQLFENVPYNTEVCSPEERRTSLLKTCSLFWDDKYNGCHRILNAFPTGLRNGCISTHWCCTFCRATQLQQGAEVTPSWLRTASVALAKRHSSVTVSGDPNTSWNQAPPIITWKTRQPQVSQMTEVCVWRLVCCRNRARSPWQLLLQTRSPHGYVQRLGLKSANITQFWTKKSEQEYCLWCLYFNRRYHCILICFSFFHLFSWVYFVL